MQNWKNICPQCGKKISKQYQYFCNEECVDKYECNSPRKPKGFIFGCDSPDRKKDPGHDYRSNEEIRVYGE